MQSSIFLLLSLFLAGNACFETYCRYVEPNNTFLLRTILAGVFAQGDHDADHGREPHEVVVRRNSLPLPVVSCLILRFSSVVVHPFL